MIVNSIKKNNDNFGDVSHSFYCCKQDDNNDYY